MRDHNEQDISLRDQETIEAAIRDGELYLYKIKNQTPEICMAAVQRSGLELDDVRDKTPEICMAAVQQDGRALQFLRAVKQTPEICMAAVRVNGLALQYVCRQTPEICMAAVQQNGRALQDVEEQTPEICMAAVRQNFKVLPSVKNPTLEIYAEALSQDKHAILYIPENSWDDAIACMPEELREEVEDYALGLREEFEHDEEERNRIDEIELTNGGGLLYTREEQIYVLPEHADQITCYPDYSDDMQSVTIYNVPHTVECYIVRDYVDDNRFEKSITHLENGESETVMDHSMYLDDDAKGIDDAYKEFDEFVENLQAQGYEPVNYEVEIEEEINPMEELDNYFHSDQYVNDLMGNSQDMELDGQNFSYDAPDASDDSEDR